jgi:hypothetical protein
MVDALVYVHLGDSSYLSNSFAVTRKYNPKLRIILIGDMTNKKYAEQYGIEFYDLEQIPHKFNYYHISVNTVPYEEICFARWLLLDHVIKMLGLQFVVYSDSDNVFFYEINTLLGYYTNPSLLYLGNEEICVPNFFYAKSMVFTAIADYVTKFYRRQPEEVMASVVKVGHHEGPHLHYSDMWLVRDVIRNLQGQEPIFKIDVPLIDRVHEVEHDTDNRLPFVINSNFYRIFYRVRSEQSGDRKPFLDKRPLFNIHFNAHTKRLIGNYVK